MGIQGTNLSSALSSAKGNDPSFTRKKPSVVVTNQSDFFTREEISYEPKKQVEKQQYDVIKTLEKENMQKVSRLVLSLFEQPLTEENKEKINTVLSEMLKNSKLGTKQKETLNKMVFKAIENYQNLPEDKKAKVKEQFEKMQTNLSNNNKVACLIPAILLMFSPGGGWGGLAIVIIGMGIMAMSASSGNSQLMVLGAL